MLPYIKALYNNKVLNKLLKSNISLMIELLKQPSFQVPRVRRLDLLQSGTSLPRHTEKVHVMVLEELSNVSLHVLVCSGHVINKF